MAKTRRGRILTIFVAAALALLLIFLGVRLHRSSQTRAARAAALQEGVAYLQTLEQADPAEVEDAIKAIHQRELEAQRAERLRQMTSGELDVWTLFEDYVLLGDSRAVGFSYYGFLPSARVLAEGGATIRNVDEHMAELRALNPAYIFLCYGLNDVSIGYWTTPEAYAAAFRQTLEKLQTALPNATVCISSILPARDPAFEKDADWYNIPQYSAAVKAVCAELNVPFADNDAISAEYAELWDVDGIHLRKEFYRYWAANLMTAVYTEDA